MIMISNLNDMLRDRFVIGLSNRATQQTLLTESDLTFVKAVNIATAREAAIRDNEASHPKNNNNSESFSVNYNKPNNNIVKSNFGKNSNNSSYNRSDHSKNATKPKSKCSGCGQLHWKRDCPFLNSECYTCKQKGHISKVCHNKAKTTNKINNHNSSNHDYAGNSDYDFVFSMEDRIDPIKYEVFLANSKVTMELDTGSFYSLMSEDTYAKTWATASERPNISPFDNPLFVYGGSPISIVGVIRVAARLVNSGKAVDADLVIVKQKGPTLLGRGLMKSLEISSINFSNVNKVNTISPLLKEFPDLFSQGLGCYKGETFSIEVDPTVEPKFCKARPVPYAMRNMVDNELDRLIAEGIIEPVNHCRWAAPMVPVLKSDMAVRICGDYKLTVNKAAKLDCYPIPKIQDLLSNLANGNIFSKLDMSQAYAQLALDEESKALTTINTHKGLFQYNRLSFGISSAPGIFQRAMENLFKDIPNVICYLDDILLVSGNLVDHNALLRKVFVRLQSAGLKLKPEKCHIGVSEVTYLGFKIDSEGLHPTASKVKAIQNAPSSTNVSQLTSYLGLLNFYRKFIPNAAILLEPLNRLLKANTV